MAQGINPNLLPVPEGYATPEQIKNMYEYSNLLTKHATETPVRHWLQGVSNVVDALVGGKTAYDANQRTIQSRNFDRGQLPTTPGGDPAAIPGMPGKQALNIPPVPGTQPGGTQMADTVLPFQDGEPQSKTADAIAKIESSGNYGAVGSPNSKGQRAYGKYQVMDFNIPTWTEEVLGKRMTPQEFLADRAAQDKVARVKLGQYESQYGSPEEAASRWFTGRSVAEGANRKDVLGTTGTEYQRRFAKAMGTEGAPSQALALQAPDSIADADGPQAISRALMLQSPRGAGGPSAAPGGVPTKTAAALPGENGGSLPIDPRLVPGRPSVSRQQFESPGFWLTPAENAARDEMYYQQNQPLTMGVPGGNVLINPKNPSVQQYMPNLEGGTIEAGEGVKVPAKWIYDYKTGTMRMVPMDTSGITPGKPAPAPAAPKPSQFAPTETPPAPFNTNGAINGNAPAAPGAAKDIQQEKSNAGPEVETKVAQTPSLIPAQPAPAVENKGTKVAENYPPLIPPQVWDLRNAVLDRKVQQAGAEETAKKAAELQTKKYDDFNKSARQAAEQLPMLDLAEQMVNDPNFYSGTAAGLVLDVKKAMSSLSDLAGKPEWKNQPASMETFKKLISGNIINQLKDAFGGLGQIRVKEMELLENANAGLNNSQPAIQALLKITKRAAERLVGFQAMASDYAAGEAIVDPQNPDKVLVPANIKNGEIEPRNKLDPQWDRFLKKYITDHPAFTPEEVKNYKELFSKKPEESAAAGGPPAAAIADLRKDPSLAAKFDEVFGPGAAAKVLGTK